MSTPLRDRRKRWEDLSSSRFDLLVVGGGITGAGVALDAASRGLRTALVERGDFAAGTSSKSSKLVHGGVRYLRQAQFGLVHEALGERKRLLRNAPHLVRPLPFLFPTMAAHRRHRGRARLLGLAARIGLGVYDLMGGRALHRTRKVSLDEAVTMMPSLDIERVTSAFCYYDAHTDDARLTLAVARTAAEEYGATLMNYAEVTNFLRDQERASGIEIRDRHGDLGACTVRADMIVNATGVWADEVRSLVDGENPESIRPAKGVHLSVPATRLPIDTAAVLGVAGDDRIIFVIRWGTHTYIGTTDTDYDGSLDDPACTPEDVRYLLEAVNAVVTEPLSAADVTGTWAGLRPLVRTGKGATTDQLSRKHAVIVGRSGVVTVTGGKMTTYRRMAADAVDAALTVTSRGGRRGVRRMRSRTAALSLIGAPAPPATGFPRDTVASGPSDILTDTYGTEADDVATLMADDPALAESLVPGLPYLRAQAVHAVRHEYALTLEDVLSRRTRALLLDAEATAAAAPDVAALIAPELGWDGGETRRQVESFVALAAAEQEAPLHLAGAVPTGPPGPAGNAAPVATSTREA
ncbi:MAG: glycerol-3-phosphate dehydrogenase/oxidase [Acidimicrobiia bacterium]|nr:glycerol-3-phosphate dehydrogenase/oxidase [Acidimicrobiia bacterium]